MNAVSPSKVCNRSLGWRLAVILCVLGLLAACGGGSKTSYYALRLPTPAPASNPRTGFVLGVERFHALNVLHDDRIIYFESPTQLNFYENHRWSSEPAMLLAELSTLALREMHLFADVHMLPSTEPADYVLKGRVLNFEEVDEGSGAKARVGLNLALVRRRDHKVVWSAERRVERPVQVKGVAGVVEALNASSQALLGEVLPELAAQVERDFTQPVPSQ